MAKVLRQTCFNHPGRDAAARCPECRRFYCRECIAEHMDRVLCANCLKKETDSEPAVSRKRTAAASFLLAGFQCVTGLFFLWMLFQFFGQLLLRIPSDFHDGTIWSSRL